MRTKETANHEAVCGLVSETHSHGLPENPMLGAWDPVGCSAFQSPWERTDLGGTKVILSWIPETWGSLYQEPQGLPRQIAFSQHLRVL